MRNHKVVMLLTVLVLFVGTVLPFKAFAASDFKILLEDDSKSTASGMYLEKGVWGDARDVDVQAVLQSVMDAYVDTYGYDYVSRLNLHTVIGQSPADYPYVTTDLKSIYLCVEGRYWARFIFQYSHELYHYIKGEASGDNRHLWFHESLAEMHSLYVLDALAVKWETDAPYDIWMDYSSAIRNYYDDRVADDNFGIYGYDLAQYYKINREVLEEEPAMLTDDGRRVVSALAPVLYKDVFKNGESAWDALTVLHSLGRCEDYTFEEYINKWYDECDDDQKTAVREIAYILNIYL